MHTFTTKPFHELTPAEYHRIVQAREQVFFLEQRITEPDADAVDPRSVFMWLEETGQGTNPTASMATRDTGATLREDHRVIAFLRMIPAGVVYNEASIGRVLVDIAHRRQGLCREMMHAALEFIDTHWGEQPIRISAQEYLAGFYLSLGFEIVSDVYTEAGIAHVKMLRRQVLFRR